MKAAVSGELTAYKRDALINEAALASMRAVYLGDLKRRIAPLLVAAFHQALNDSGADELLDGLRGRFDQAAEAIATARDLIPIEQSAEQFMHTATREALDAWQSLDTHLAVITDIAAIAAQFGCRLGKFALIEEYSLGDGYKLDDRAMWCCDGELVTDSHPFHRPSGGHRASPWFWLPLRLHTVASARDRYRQSACNEWERLHAGPVTSWLDSDGKAHEMPRPVNPYAEPAEVSG